MSLILGCKMSWNIAVVGETFLNSTHNLHIGVPIITQKVDMGSIKSVLGDKSVGGPV